MSDNGKMGRISYRVGNRCPVHLAIHEVQGSRISILVDEADHPIGNFVAEFELRGPYTDLYYYNLRIGSQVTTRPL